MRLVEPLDLVTPVVQSLYHAENQLILALPRIAARATHPDLQAALQNHLKETREHSTRLEQAAGALGIPAAGKCCHAMNGLLHDGEEAMGFGGEPALVDALIIADCKAVETFEITKYTFLLNLLAASDRQDVSAILKPSLDSEEEASKKLDTILATVLSERGTTLSII